MKVRMSPPPSPSSNHASLIGAITHSSLRGVTVVLDQDNPWLGSHDFNSKLLEAMRRSANHLALLELLVGRGMNLTPFELSSKEREIVSAALADAATYRRQAHELGIVRLDIQRAKAWGIAFVPGDGQLPLVFGGDYDGAWPVDADYVLASWHQDQPGTDSSVSWFYPYVQKIAAGEDFDLAEVMSQLDAPYQIVRARPDGNYR